MSFPANSLKDMADEKVPAVERLKKYLADPVRRIELYDFMMSEVDGVIESVRDLPVDVLTGPGWYAENVKAYEKSVARLLDLFVVGVFHSNDAEHDRLWARCVDRLASRDLEHSGNTLLSDMQQYPTLLALYAIGLGGAAADRIDSIARVLGSVTVRKPFQLSPVGVGIGASGALSEDAIKQAFPDLARHKTPISDRLLEVLCPMVSGFVPSGDRYEDLFDEVEYLLGLAYAAHQGGGWGPLGRAVWRCRQRQNYPGALTNRHAQVLIEANVFESDTLLAETRQAYDQQMNASHLRI